jgi:ActR/RegA family two-component response regulator
MIKLPLYLIKDSDGTTLANFTSELKALNYVKLNRKTSIERIEVELDPEAVKAPHHNEKTPNIRKVLNWKEVLYNHMVRVLESNRGNIAKTARDIGMNDTNFRYRFKTFNKLFLEK